MPVKRVKLWVALIPLLMAIPVLLVIMLNSGGDTKPKRTTAAEALYKSVGETPQAPPPSRVSSPEYYRTDKLSEVELPYSKFLQLSDQKVITDALVVVSSSQVNFLRKKSGKVYKSIVPPTAIDRITEKLSKQGASVDVLPASKKGSSGMSFWSILLLISLALMFFMALRFFMMRGNPGAGGAGGLRRDPTKLRDAEVSQATGVSFSDVAGCPEVVEEVSEFVDFLKDPVRFRKLGARMPGGLLLYGPPGTGKTLVAKAMAGEAGVPFFAVSGSEFVEKYVGVGASRVRELFEKARKSDDGAVVFIDEIDAIGRARDGQDMNSERDQTLNELLAQLDGFSTTDRVVVVAATNRREILDAALLRPGRLARQVKVGTPDRQGRLEILEIHAKGKPLSPEVDLAALAETTAGCSGADLADMLNEAAIMAAREDKESIGQDHLIEGQLRAVAGPAKRSSMSEEEREMVAYHEAGHVLCAELCEEHEKAQRATIRPRGDAGGLALYGQQDRALHSTQYLHERLICALGGRAAEWVQYGKVSSGAANDLQQANGVARTAVQELGFSPRTGQMIISADGREVRVSDQTRQVVDREVERMVAEAYAQAVSLLSEHKGALDSLARNLLSQEDLDRLEIVAAIGLDNAPPRQSRPAPQMAPQTVPVLHQRRAPRVRSRLRNAGQGVSRRVAQAFRRKERALDS